MEGLTDEGGGAVSGATPSSAGSRSVGSPGGAPPAIAGGAPGSASSGAPRAPSTSTRPWQTLDYSYNPSTSMTPWCQIVLYEQAPAAWGNPPSP